ncbi:MAG: site-specific integrase [Spirochaetales bacterium]|nr:site-specific integrase [Spirochaetales bacterium]
MGLSVKLLLDTRRERVDKTYPLVMRVIINTKSLQIPTGYTLLKSNWDTKNQKIKSSCKQFDNLSRINNLLHKRKSQAFDILTKLDDDGELDSLPMSEVKTAILGEKTRVKMSVIEFMNQLIEDMTKAGKVGNARVYKMVANRLESFTNGKKLNFDSINYAFLHRFENAHFANGGDKGGLSVYLRTLRAVYNKAIKMGVAKESRYPFKNYQIKNGTPDRKALSEEEFQTLLNAELKKGSALEKARNYFLASFYLRGMNWMDMALLRLGNIEGDLDRVRYTRQKTGKGFNIKVNARLRPILEAFIDGRTDKEAFVFPILNLSHKPERYSDVILNKRKKLNGYLKRIAKDNGLPSFTIYTARHTYATMGKRKGVPTAIIQESLGHTTEAITQNYLDSFGNDIIDKYDDLIMD